MKRILYIESSPRKTRSHSIDVVSEFIREYEKFNPEDRIEVFDLWSNHLPSFSGEILDIKYRIMHGEMVNEKEESGWNEVKAISNSFKEADKYVFSIPMWKFGIPYKLKHYIDIITQPNLTWSFSPNAGYKGLVDGKVAIFYSSGGNYSSSSGIAELDSQKKPFENWLNFIGLTEFTAIDIAPTMGLPEDVKGVIEKSKDEAKKLAETF